MATKGFVNRRKDKRDKPYPDVESLYRANQSSYAGVGGFIAEDEEEETGRATSSYQEKNKDSEEEEERSKQLLGDTEFSSEGRPLCFFCGLEFPYSFLYDTFQAAICDKCREADVSRGKLITRSQAKEAYFLKDADIDSRGAKLPFLSKKNPHNPRWGDMKLYLKSQVEKRALDVWGTWEELEDAKKSRIEAKEKQKEKKFEKRLQELRRQVKGEGKYSTKPAPHKHEFGPEVYCEKSDCYTRTCISCKETDTYEKL